MKFIQGKLGDTVEIEKRHPLFPRAFAFLRRPDLQDLAPGRYPIAGDGCFASVSEIELKPVADEMTYEFHRTFIDIQAPITGSETLGVVETPASALSAYDAAKDCALFPCRGRTITLAPGDFAIFFPDTDAHAPCHAGDAPRRLKKVVVKVRR